MCSNEELAFKRIMSYADMSQSILDKITGGDENIQRSILMNMPQQYLWMFGSNFEHTHDYNNNFIYHYDFHPLSRERGKRGDFVAIISLNAPLESDRNVAKVLRRIITNSKRIAILNRLEKLKKYMSNCNNDLLPLWEAEYVILSKRYENAYARTVFYENKK